MSPRPVWGSPADSDWGKIQDTGRLKQAQEYVQSVRVCTHVYDGCVCTVVRAADLCVCMCLCECVCMFNMLCPWPCMCAHVCESLHEPVIQAALCTYM